MVDCPTGIRRRRRLRRFLTIRRRVRVQLLMALEHSNRSLSLWRRMIRARVAASALLCDAVLLPALGFWGLKSFFFFWLSVHLPPFLVCSLFCPYAHNDSTLYDHPPYFLLLRTTLLP